MRTLERFVVPTVVLPVRIGKSSKNDSSSVLMADCVAVFADFTLDRNQNDFDRVLNAMTQRNFRRYSLRDLLAILPQYRMGLR